MEVSQSLTPPFLLFMVFDHRKTTKIFKKLLRIKFIRYICY